MKILSAIILCFLFVIAQAQHTAHWKVATKGGDGHVIYPAMVDGDTLAINGNLSTWSYCSMSQLQFSCNNPLVIINFNSQVQMTNGFQFIGCRGIKLTGSGAIGVQYGFKIVGNGGGVPVTYQDTCSCMEADSMDISNCLSAFWCKNEQDCRPGINYPFGLFHIYVHDCYMHHCQAGGDMMYFGSTDPYGVSRSIVCNGVIVHPRPSRLGWIRISNNIIDSAGRQAIQINNGDTGYIVISGNQIRRAGWGMEVNQGNGIFIGQGTKNDSIYKNTIRQTWQHSYWCYGYGLNVTFGNNCDSSGMIAGFVNFAESPFEISGVPNTGRSNFSYMCDTFGTHSSDPSHYKLAIDNSMGNILNTGNSYCDALPVYNPQNVSYSSTCTSCAVTPPDTVCTTTVIVHDSLVLGHFTRVINYTDTIIGADSIWYTFVNTSPYKMIHHKIATTIVFLDSLQHYDSAYICHLCTPPHDTTICVITGFIDNVPLGDFALRRRWNKPYIDEYFKKPTNE
jgi:hypothetical protein